MSQNLFNRIRNLFPTAPLQVGDVVAYANGEATIELPSGGRLHARGQTTVGARVYFRDGVIEGPAPDLPVFQIEV